MPTYEYACSKCGHHFEQFQSMKDEPLKQCPKCGKKALKRLIGHGGGLIFKGSGFYSTDYRKEPRPKEGGEGKPSGDSKPAAGDSKPSTSEAKPASPPKPAPKTET
jgi:putative FmdB family regulatory protein